MNKIISAGFTFGAHFQGNIFFCWGGGGVVCSEDFFWSSTIKVTRVCVRMILKDLFFGHQGRVD